MKTLQVKVGEALDLPLDSVKVTSVGGPIHPSVVTVIDPSFEGMTEFERQSQVWDALEARGIDTREVGLVMANTPEEDRVLREQRDNETDEPESGYAEAL